MTNITREAPSPQTAQLHPLLHKYARLLLAHTFRAGLVFAVTLFTLVSGLLLVSLDAGNASVVNHPTASGGKTIQLHAGHSAKPTPTAPRSHSRLLPGEQIWQGGHTRVSSYLFGTNNTYNWSPDNIETNATARHLLHAAGVTLIRTWFFSPHGYASNLATRQETDLRLKVDHQIGARCLGVLQDARPRSFRYYRHLIRYVGNRCLIYEFGNEPGVGGSPDMTQYIRNWNTEIPRFRKLNPRAKFGGPAKLSADAVSTFLSGVKRAGVLPDFVSIHQYSPDPTVFGTDITEVKKIVQQELGHQIPVGITEFNYRVGTHVYNPHGPAMTRYWTQVYNVLIQARADFATEFTSFNHGGTVDSDMFDSDARPRPVYNVLKEFVSHYKQ